VDAFLDFTGAVLTEWTIIDTSNLNEQYHGCIISNEQARKAGIISAFHQEHASANFLFRS
jgi:hypothetical protein